MYEAVPGFRAILRHAISLRGSKWAEGCLWAAAAASLGGCAYIESKAWIAQIEGNRQFDRKVVHASRSSRPAAGSIVGRLEVPRLGMSMVVVFEGAPAMTHPGSWRGTLEWLAPAGRQGQRGDRRASRLTFSFEGLRNVQDKDVVAGHHLAGLHSAVPGGKSTRIVNPTETAVLAPASQGVLTLITCYPFVYLGHAPQRFIVRAREIEP